MSTGSHRGVSSGNSSGSQGTHDVKLEKLGFYRAEIKHEFNLLSNRVNAYITSQSFLVVGFALAMGNLNPQWGSLFRLIFPPRARAAWYRHLRSGVAGYQGGQRQHQSVAREATAPV
jgi:hypothetical protein